MLLTCPQCRSGLQVPDGTTAMVRCPACKNIFSPDDESEEDEPKVKYIADPEEEKRKASRKPYRDDEERRKAYREEEEEEEKPRKKIRVAQGEQEEQEENRDFNPFVDDPERTRERRRQNRQEQYEKLSPEEKAARSGAFQRAAWGARLIWVSFGLFILSMLCVMLLFFLFLIQLFSLSKIVAPTPNQTYIILAGLLGLFSWIIGAIGLGLCLSGPQVPGHWGYGIPAAIVTALHLFLLLVLVARGDQIAIGQTTDSETTAKFAKWGQLPTRIDSTVMFIPVKIYRDDIPGIPNGGMTLAMIVGLLEMLRTVLLLLVMSCLARAALDDNLSHKCTRAAGAVSIAPGTLGAVFFALIATLITVNAFDLLFMAFYGAMMSIYAFLFAIMVPAFRTAREVADTCDEPFQSLIPEL